MSYLLLAAAATMAVWAALWTRLRVRRAAAEQLYRVGLEAWHGSLRVPENPRKAAIMFHQAAAQGHRKAAFALTFMMYEGIYDTGFAFLDGLPEVRNRYGDPEQLDEADAAAMLKPYLRWCQREAAKEDPVCQAMLGILYLRGESVPENADLSESWYRRSAVLGYAPAQMMMASSSFAASEDEKLEWLLKAANQGHPAAAFQLGWKYARGQDGMQQDHARALVRYETAAAGGHVEACYELGWMHAQGLGCPRSATAALPWFRKAADAGLDAAQAMAAFMLEAGVGGMTDPVAAARYRAVAGDKLAGACFKIGLTYSSDPFVHLDYLAAAGWYRRAADLGHDQAQFCLGDLYEQGLGVPQDASLADHWYRKAAASGHPGAAGRLKGSYRMPDGSIFKLRPAP